jgi:hypothetical protein
MIRIRGELTIRHFNGRGGQKIKGNIGHKWSGIINLRPDPLNLKRVSLKDKLGRDTQKVELYTNSWGQLVCSIEATLWQIYFYLDLSKAGDSCTVQGRKANGEYAPYFSCSFKRVKESRLQVWWKKLRG